MQANKKKPLDLPGLKTSSSEEEKAQLCWHMCKEFVDAEVVDLFTKYIPPVFHINTQIRQASTKSTDLPYHSHPSSRPLCLLLPLLRAFPNLVLSQ